MDHKREDRTPPLATVMRVGRQQQHIGESYIIIYSNQHDTHHRCVALIMNNQSASTRMDYYKMTNDSDDEVKENWYNKLQTVVTKIPQHDMLLVMEDMIAKVESDNTDRERAMGSQDCGTMNNNGERLVNFCPTNNCAIDGTIFQHKYIHKLTWMSPDGNSERN